TPKTTIKRVLSKSADQVLTEHWNCIDQLEEPVIILERCEGCDINDSKDKENCKIYKEKREKIVAIKRKYDRD
ncbi:4825_t:CDS:2, partial [Racocetra fulgida]